MVTTADVVRCVNMFVADVPPCNRPGATAGVTPLPVASTLSDTVGR
jgi:hypothetical protein